MYRDSLVVAQRRRTADARLCRTPVLSVNSQASSGDTVVAPGTYKNVEVNHRHEPLSHPGLG